MPDYFEVADTASIWDNIEEADSKNPAIKILVRKSMDGAVTIFPAAAEVNWVKKYLLNTYPQEVTAAAR